jgi:hypothetical protein
MVVEESIQTRGVGATVVAISSGAIGIAISRGAIASAVSSGAVGIAILSTCVTIASTISSGAVGIAILSTCVTIAQVRIAAIEIFQSHEGVRPLADLLLYARVIREIPIELRMTLQELWVVDQRRRSAQLVGNFAMTIEKLIEARQVSARDVIAWYILPPLLPVLRGRGLHGCRLRGRRLRVTSTREPQQRRCTENQS